MNLQNDYKVIYEVITEGKRAFYASKDANCVPTGDEKLVEATIGEYRLIYEKDGRIYGSVSGIPAEGDYCFEGFDKVFKVATPDDVPAEEPDVPANEPEVPADPETPDVDPEDAE